MNHIHRHVKKEMKGSLFLLLILLIASLPQQVVGDVCNVSDVDDAVSVEVCVRVVSWVTDPRSKTEADGCEVSDVYDSVSVVVADFPEHFNLQRQKANKYGFIRLTKPAMEPWSKKKGVEQIITIEITPEDNLRIKRRK